MNSLTILSISDLLEIKELYVGMEVQVVSPSQDSGGCGVQGHLLIYIAVQGQAWLYKTLHTKTNGRKKRKHNENNVCLKYMLLSFYTKCNIILKFQT